MSPAATRSKLPRIAIATLAALLVQAGTALAAGPITVNVSRFDDPDPSGMPDCSAVSCSLREAINFAEGGTNTVSLAPGTYELTRGELVVNGNLFVSGPGARSTTIEQLKPGERVLDVRAPVTGFALTGVTVTGGSTDDSTPFEPGGAGIRTESAVGATLTDDAIVGNHSYSAMSPSIAFGAGVSNHGTMVMIGTTVADNHATSNGVAAGGIADLQTLYINNSTIANNGATIFDAVGTTFAVGGVDVGFFSGALLSTASVTFSGNHALGGTAVNTGNLLVPINQSEFRSVDTIYAGGSGDPGHENCSVNAGALVKSRGYNLQDRGQQCGLAKAGDLFAANPLLSALANNGGPTDTFALGLGSAAIDRGTPGKCPDSGSSTLVQDQRGRLRVQGGRCDIGAFESTAIPAPKLSKLEVSPSPFHRGKGASVSYTDSEKATTRLTVLRLVRGVRKGVKCVPPPKKKSAKKPKRCTLIKLVGSFSHADSAGLNLLHWNGRVKGKKLAAGRYKLQALAHNAQGKPSAALTIGFKVIR